MNNLDFFDDMENIMKICLYTDASVWKTKNGLPFDFFSISAIVTIDEVPTLHFSSSIDTNLLMMPGETMDSLVLNDKRNKGGLQLSSRAESFCVITVLEKYSHTWMTRYNAGAELTVYTDNPYVFSCIKNHRFNGYKKDRVNTILKNFSAKAILINSDTYKKRANNQELDISLKYHEICDESCREHSRLASKGICSKFSTFYYEE